MSHIFLAMEFIRLEYLIRYYDGVTGVEPPLISNDILLGLGGLSVFKKQTIHLTYISWFQTKNNTNFI